MAKSREKVTCSNKRGLNGEKLHALISILYEDALMHKKSKRTTLVHIRRKSGEAALCRRETLRRRLRSPFGVRPWRVRKSGGQAVP